MKKLILLPLILFLGCSGTKKEQPAETFALAEKAYQEGRYADALDFFHKLDTSKEFGIKAKAYIHRIDSTVTGHGSDPAANEANAALPQSDTLANTPKNIDIFGNEGFISLDDSESSDSQSFLVFYKEDEKGTDCYILELPKTVPVLLARFESTPLDAVWDTANGIAYFVMADGSFRLKYKDKGALEKIAGPLPANSEFSRAWLDEKSGRFRVCYSVYSDGFDETLRKRYQELAKGQPELLDESGGLVSNISMMDEVDGAGNWKRIQDVAQRNDPHFIQGPRSVFEINPVESTYSMTSQLSHSTCFSMHDRYIEEITLHPVDYQKYFDEQNIPVPDVGGFVVEWVSNKYNLLVEVHGWDIMNPEEGEPSYGGQVYLVDKKNRSMSALPSVGEWLDKSGDYVMMSTQDDRGAVVYDANHFTQISSFPGASQPILIRQNKD